VEVTDRMWRGIFMIVGIGLLVLGGASGTALFLRATLMPAPTPGAQEAKATLWGLFGFGMLTGIIRVAIAH
jgi:hypothetical protein